MKKLLASMLALLVINLACATFAGAQQQPGNDDKHVRKIKKQIAHQKRWAPEDPIIIKFNDGTSAKGYVAEVLDDHFVITDRKGQQPASVEYAQIKTIKSGFGGNLKENFALAVGGGVLAILAICLISKSCSK